jgi:hypothetical protein
MGSHNGKPLFKAFEAKHSSVKQITESNYTGTLTSHQKPAYGKIIGGKEPILVIPSKKLAAELGLKPGEKIYLMREIDIYPNVYSPGAIGGGTTVGNPITLK